MELEQLENQCQEHLNALGLKCPMPVIKLQQTARKLEKNAIISIDFDDPAGAKDIANWAKVNKHQIESLIDLEKGQRIYMSVLANKVTK
ncbi:sulfurtransferase TusA family protein [Thiomicrorhabdus indica]|uniref:sulfurtransferase TusA family protein n=1 Tax=Thiomicrorhabdus indica TaxID=2267253 RepID=UPI002AA81C4D|nr:sulfurtransferase TusA family protein [Thiomicrorhabdus indica]